MCLNHPETIPHSNPWKNCLPWNQSLVPKKFRDCCLNPWLPTLSALWNHLGSFKNYWHLGLTPLPKGSYLTVWNVAWDSNHLARLKPAPKAIQGFPGGSDGKGSACNTGDLGLIPGSGRSPGEGHSNPFQYSCLENPHGQRSLAGYSPGGCKESDMTERLSTHKAIQPFQQDSYLLFKTHSRTSLVLWLRIYLPI